MIGIFPYMDQGPLYNVIDPNYGITTDPRGTNKPSNAWAAQQIITAFKCPSDPSTSTLGGRSDFETADGNFASLAYGTTCYKAVNGANWAWGNWLSGGIYDITRLWPLPTNNGLDFGNGLICRNWGVPHSAAMRDVTDGTSNTLAVGEAVPGYSAWNWWWNSNANTGTCSVPLNAPPVCGAAAGLNKQAGLKVCNGDWGNNYSFASMHTGGGHFLMCDGSVKFVSENIDYNMYRNMATVSGGEIASLAD
jgi:prepilin-type processing-associated H-X9-DG protein